MECILYVLSLGYGSLEVLGRHGKEGISYKEAQKLSAFHYSPI